MSNLQGVIDINGRGVGRKPEAKGEAPAAERRSPGTDSKKSKGVTHEAPARFPALFSFVLVVVVLIAGWRVRGEELITAENGTGYYLGIIGGAMMLLLLAYPMRKKLKFMRNWGATRHWFRMHMILGVLGPVLVLFHANFRVGSTNSMVVLYTTMLVAGSGLVGRYIYSKVHYGLYGRQVTLKDLQEEIEGNNKAMAMVFGYAPRLKDRLHGFEGSVLKAPSGFVHSFARILTIWPRCLWHYMVLSRNLKRAMAITAKRSNWNPEQLKRVTAFAKQSVSVRMATVIKIAEFSFYERLLSMWHLFHFPFFILLMIVAVVHILAVHMY